MSYYKIIDGVKYDRSLLTAARFAASGPRDGRISLADAQQLLQKITDGNKVTQIELMTIAYIRQRFRWTAAADRWFMEELSRIRPKTWQEEMEKVIKQEFELLGMQVRIEEDEVRYQQESYPGMIEIEAALRAAIQRILSPSPTQEETPWLIVKEVHYEKWEILPSEAEQHTWIRNKVMDYLRAGVISLLPYVDPLLSMKELEEQHPDYYPPEEGERVEQNWIFFLSLPTLSDHLYWVIIDRVGEKEGYVYGFN